MTPLFDKLLNSSRELRWQWCCTGVWNPKLCSQSACPPFTLSTSVTAAIYIEQGWANV